MTNSERNVMARLCYVFQERYDRNPSMNEQAAMLSDWKLAKTQFKATYLTDAITETIIAWRK